MVRCPRYLDCCILFFWGSLVLQLHLAFIMKSYVFVFLLHPVLMHFISKLNSSQIWMWTIESNQETSFTVFKNAFRLKFWDLGTGSIDKWFLRSKVKNDFTVQVENECDMRYLQDLTTFWLEFKNFWSHEWTRSNLSKNIEHDELLKKIIKNFLSLMCLGVS